MTEILVSLGALIALVLGAWGKGRYDARQDAKAERAKAIDKALATREAIDDEVQNDPHLAQRARDSGLLRPGGK